MKYLLDTNAVIYHLSGNRSCSVQYSEEDKVAVSIISKIELFSKELTKEQEVALKSYLDNIETINMSGKIADETIEIRRKYKLKIPDAIITATEKVENYILVTADEGILKKPLDIEIVNPLGV